MKTKRFLKKLATTAAGIAMALIIAVGFSFSPAASVSAAVSTIGTISAGSSYDIAWDGSEHYLGLNIKQTGFYSLTVTDYREDGIVVAILTDTTTDEIKGYILESITEPFVLDKLYLVAGHNFELRFAYANSSLQNYVSASMTIDFEESDYHAAEIPSGTISQSDLSLNFKTDGETEWLKFTTDTAGDYCLNFTNLGAYISVCNASNGEWIYQNVDTEYYDKNTEGYVAGNKKVFNLAANTTYYFYINNYYQNATTKLSMTKNTKTVEFIEIAGTSSDITSWDTIDSELFNYRVTYTNGTTSTLSYLTLCEDGIQLPMVFGLGNSIEVNGEYLLEGGKTPVVSVYGDDYENYSLSYVDVDSVTDWLSSIQADKVEAYDNCVFDNGGTEEQLGYWYICVDETAYYSYTSGGTFDRYLDSWSAVMIDEQNNIVEFNEDLMAWPLVAGRYYAFSLARTFKEDAAVESLEFHFRPEAEKIFPDTAKNGWYYDAVTYSVGRGIMTGYASNGKFGTSDSIQRQDFLVMLARLSGVDLSAYEDMHGQFPDVAKNSYYEAAVMWGYENGIVTGYENGKFGVGDKITREQLVTFLYRYADYVFADTSYSVSTQNKVKSQYNDYKNVSAFAEDAVLWAIEKGAMSGKNSTTIAPQGNAQRCEVAQIMYNIFKNDVF